MLIPNTTLSLEQSGYNLTSRHFKTINCDHDRKANERGGVGTE